MNDSIALITPMASMICTNKAHKGIGGISANAFADGILRRISSFMGWRPVSLFFLPEADAVRPVNGLYVSAEISLRFFNRLEQNANVFRQTLKNNGLLYRETVIRENAKDSKRYQVISATDVPVQYEKGMRESKLSGIQVLPQKAAYTSLHTASTMAVSPVKHATSAVAAPLTKPVATAIPPPVLQGESVFVNFRGNRGEIIKHEETRVFSRSSLFRAEALAAAHIKAGTAPLSIKYADHGVFKRNEPMALSHAQMVLVGPKSSNRPRSEALPGRISHSPVQSGQMQSGQMQSGQMQSGQMQSGQMQSERTRQWVHSGQSILGFGTRSSKWAATMREDTPQKASGSPPATEAQKTPSVSAVTQNMAPREYKTFQPATMVMFTPPSYVNRYGVETPITSAAGDTGISRANQEANDFFRMRAAFDAQLDASGLTKPTHGRQYPHSEITYKESAGDITNKLLSQHQDTPKKIDMQVKSSVSKSDSKYKLNKQELSKLSNEMYEMLESQVKAERFRHGY